MAIAPSWTILQAQLREDSALRGEEPSVLKKISECL